MGCAFCLMSLAVVQHVICHFILVAKSTDTSYIEPKRLVGTSNTTTVSKFPFLSPTPVLT